MQIKNNTFIVTGGGSGLGQATANMLIEQGANVVVADLKSEDGDDGGKRVFVKADVTSEEDVKNVIDTAESHFGSFQGVVNCAGIAVVAKVLDRDGNPHDLNLFAKGIQVNLIGSFNVARLNRCVNA